MEAESNQPFFSFSDVFAPTTYNVEIFSFKDLEACKAEYDIPKFNTEKKDISYFDQKLTPLDIFKISTKDNEDEVYICEEFAYSDKDDPEKLRKLLRTVRKHPNLFEFVRILVLEREKRLWLLSLEEDLTFIKRRLNRETKNPFSLCTIMNFCHDLESALDHLSKIRDNNLNVFEDILTPFITTTGILHSQFDNTFKIGLSLSYANHFDIEKRYAPNISPKKTLKGKEKQTSIIESLGRVMLEVVIGYFTKIEDGKKLEILDSPLVMEGTPPTVDKIKDILTEIRKEHLFSLNVSQLAFLDSNHVQKIVQMITKNLSWKDAIEEKYFRTRVWSYRVDPVQVLSSSSDPDWIYTFVPDPKDFKRYLLNDGINCTFFLDYYYQEKVPLTNENWKDYLEDEQKVNRFIDDITSRSKTKLIQNKKDDAVTFTFDKSLDIMPEESRKGFAKIELIALWSKNCIVHKCSLDILTLSVEFGDDLNHLSSVIASTFPYMSTEIDEHRRIVFRIANTLSPGDRVIDMMIDTLDQMLITINTVRLKFDDCIKGEKFGRLAKAATFIAEEIVEKIREYQEFKRRVIIDYNKKKSTQ